MSRAITSKSVVSRQRQSTDGPAGARVFISGKLRPVGRGAGDLLTEYLLAPPPPSAGNRPFFSWRLSRGRRSCESCTASESRFLFWSRQWRDSDPSLEALQGPIVDRSTGPESTNAR